MRQRIAAVALALGLVLATGEGALAGKYGKRIGMNTASGERARVMLGANATRPRALYVYVNSTPHQRVRTAVFVICRKDGREGSKLTAFNRVAPEARRVVLPMPLPDSCGIGASAELEGAGRVKIVLYKR